MTPTSSSAVPHPVALGELLASQPQLPAMPRIVALLLSELGRAQPDLKTVAQLLAGDPGLSMRLLQLANAAFFKMQQRVHSVAEALALVGLGHVRTIAAACASAVAPRALPAGRLQQISRYSADASRVARSLAGALHLNQQSACSAGLLHCAGDLAMWLTMPETMLAIDGACQPLDPLRALVQRERLGYSYADAGAGLARQWQFPPAIVAALAQQEAPLAHADCEPLAAVVHLAAWRARSRADGLSQRAMAVSFPGAVGEVLGLDIDMVLQQDPIDWSGPR